MGREEQIERRERGERTCTQRTQVAQLSQSDRATQELLRFAKFRSGISEPPFWGLRENVDASCVRRWKKRGRLGD